MAVFSIVIRGCREDRQPNPSQRLTVFTGPHSYTVATAMQCGHVYMLCRCGLPVWLHCQDSAAPHTVTCNDP